MVRAADPSGSCADCLRRPDRIPPALSCRGLSSAPAVSPDRGGSIRSRLSPHTTRGAETYERDRASHRRIGDKGGAVQSGADAETFGEAEERILKMPCGSGDRAWNDLPTKIYRHLFRRAVAMGDPGNVSELKAEIARFLHNSKNDEACQASARWKSPSPQLIR